MANYPIKEGEVKYANLINDVSVPVVTAIRSFNSTDGTMEDPITYKAGTVLYFNEELMEELNPSSSGEPVCILLEDVEWFGEPIPAVVALSGKFNRNALVGEISDDTVTALAAKGIYLENAVL